MLGENWEAPGVPSGEPRSQEKGMPHPRDWEPSCTESTVTGNTMVWNIVIGSITTERAITWSTVGELPQGTPSEGSAMMGNTMKWSTMGVIPSKQEARPILRLS